ncbi:hypothetical protein [Carnobacterium iners]|nr:hypothetical protein [Carnobacterium iners]SEK93838.1 hypothetical protein SAMN04488114_1179 [Carnobacterium iners]
MDFNYRTNQLIAIMSLVVAAIGWILIGKISSGLYVGSGVFLTWSLSRELDPKHDYSAFLAAAFSGLNLFYYETIQLLVIFWIILLMRIVNGITGESQTFFDLFSVLGLSIYLSFNNENSIYLLVYVLAMALILINRQKSKKVLLASGISLGLFIIETFFMGYLTFNRADYLSLVNVFSLVVLGLSFVLFWFLSKEKVEDDKGNPVKRYELLASQFLFSAIILLLILFSQLAINNLIIYLSVIVGVAIYFIGYKLIKRD